MIKEVNMWEPTISHSAGPWKKHKYIRKEGNRYIYPNGQLATQRGWRDKVGDDKLSDATKSAVNAQKQGFKRTENERAKFWKDQGFKPINGKYNEEVERAALKGFAKRNLEAQKATKAAQEAGKKRTEYEKKKRSDKANAAVEAANKAGYRRTKYEQSSKDNAYLLKSTNYGDRLEGRRRVANAVGDYEKARKLDKQVVTADRVYSDASRAANTDRRRGTGAGGMARYNPTNKPPKNKTARKNQRRAKIEYAKYKVRSTSRKALKSGKKKLNSLLNKIKRR